MKGIKLSAIALVACLAFTCGSLGQTRNTLEDSCDSLRNATLPDLVRFLNTVIPDETNRNCVTWAIHKLGNEQYEPAIAPLVRLLDFRRAPTQREKTGFPLHPQGVWEIYPSVGAIPLIGKKALPDLLRVIEADPTSTTTRENAIAAWMEIYRKSDEQPKGVRQLKEEETKTQDAGIKERLNWAVSKAMTWCNPPDQPACKEAAKTR